MTVGALFVDTSEEEVEAPLHPPPPAFFPGTPEAVISVVASAPSPAAAAMGETGGRAGDDDVNVDAGGEGEGVAGDGGFHDDGEGDRGCDDNDGAAEAEAGAADDAESRHQRRPEVSAEGDVESQLPWQRQKLEKKQQLRHQQRSLNSIAFGEGNAESQMLRRRRNQPDDLQQAPHRRLSRRYTDATKSVFRGGTVGGPPPFRRSPGTVRWAEPGTAEDEADDFGCDCVGGNGGGSDELFDSPATPRRGISSTPISVQNAHPMNRRSRAVAIMADSVSNWFNSNENAGTDVDYSLHAVKENVQSNDTGEGAADGIADGGDNGGGSADNDCGDGRDEEDNGGGTGGGNDDHNEKGDDQGEMGQVFKLEMAKETKWNNCLSTVRNYGKAEPSLQRDPNIFVDFFYWMSRNSWKEFLFVSLLAYYFFVVAWALLFLFSSRWGDEGECQLSGGYEMGTYRPRFLDAFALSWSTFSTVGYGSTSGALSSHNFPSGDCSCGWTIYFTSLEALAGVLYVEFFGALIFAKAMRIAECAQVAFSQPLLMRYASGITEEEYEDQEGAWGDKAKEEALKSVGSGAARTELRGKGDTDDAGNSCGVVGKAARTNPFPVLEFRIANELHNISGGEIINTTVNAAVMHWKDPADPDYAVANKAPQRRQEGEHSVRRSNLASAVAKLTRVPSFRSNRNSKSSWDIQSTRSLDELPKRSTARRRGASSRSSNAAQTVSSVKSLDDLTDRSVDNAEISSTRSDEESLTESERERELVLHSILKAFGRGTGTGPKRKIDEDEVFGQNFVPQLVTEKLKLNNVGLPFFKRIWKFHHVVDGDSPLLTPAAQRTVRANGGRWPRSLNDPALLRDAVQFDQIIVSFAGISNVSASPVFSQRVYERGDMVVGYQFVSAIYNASDGRLKVDLDLVDDVVEQNGGGGEPLHFRESGPP